MHSGNKVMRVRVYVWACVFIHVQYLRKKCVALNALSLWCCCTALGPVVLRPHIGVNIVSSHISSVCLTALVTKPFISAPGAGSIASAADWRLVEVHGKHQLTQCSHAVLPVGRLINHTTTLEMDSVSHNKTPAPRLLTTRCGFIGLLY